MPLPGSPANSCSSPPLLTPPHPTPQAADWREQAILQFRIMRKRALRQTLEKLAAKLGPDAAGADSTGVGKAAWTG